MEEHLWKTKHVRLQIYTSSIKFTSEILEIFQWHYFWETVIIDNLMCTTKVFGMQAKSAASRELRVNPQHTDRFTLNMSQAGRRLSRRNQGKQR